jgi:2-octaprenyl-6-methoxyphenol hydroxylase
LTGGALPVHLVERRSRIRRSIRGLMPARLRWRRGPASSWRVSASGKACRLRDADPARSRQRPGHAGFVTLSELRPGGAGQVELHDIGQRLFAQREAPGITHPARRKWKTSPAGRRRQPDPDSGETIEGQLLVAADGSRSTLGARCGISWQQQPYEQLAIIANVSTALPIEGRAFERFTEHGPLAMLPMSQDAVRWCGVTRSRGAMRCWAGPTNVFAAAAAGVWLAAGRITHAGKRSVYPLALTTAMRGFASPGAGRQCGADAASHRRAGL